jgi:3',5'-cyclic AMP phosphodiesterase CpdA
MRLRVLSDLHIDVNKGEPYTVADASDCDVVVIAGDVAEKVATRGMNWLAREIRARGWELVYVPGNHDFYRTTTDRELEKARVAAAEHGIHLLATGESVVIRGTRFIGATLWTDYQVAGNQSGSMAEARRQMNDHKLIRQAATGYRRFFPLQALEAHREQLARIEAELAVPFDGPTVVVTHHPPHPRSLQHGEPRELIDSSYASDLTSVIERYRPSLWIHGHVHVSNDYLVGETRIVSNPRGYVIERGVGKTRTVEPENPNHDPALTVEVGRRAVTHRSTDDPLGYDTCDPGYLRQMIDDVATGRTREALDAELARVREVYRRR